MITSGTPSYISHPSARPSSLPSPPSLDIAAVLAPAGAFEDLELLAPPLSFTSTSSDGESNLEDVPPFPKDHRPPLFIIQDHRAQVPFAVQLDVTSLGDMHVDEQAARNVPSTPTIPRMNMVMKEQLFMQSWIEKLTPQRPPKHVPWTSDEPVPRREWISEGSIFPGEINQSRTGKIRHARMIQLTHSKVTTPHSAHCIRDHPEAAVISKECPGGQAGSKLWSVHAFESGPNAPICGQKEKWAQQDSHTPKPCSYKTINRLTSTCRDTSWTLPQIGSSPSLSVRRGKKLSDLQLDDMEYSDLPTPFRGSPTDWSPKFDIGISSLNEELFTDHRSMLSNLRSQYAALASEISTPTAYEIKQWQAVSMDFDNDSVTSKPSTSNDDDCAFEKAFVVTTEDIHGPVDNSVPPPSFILNNAPDRPGNSLNDHRSSCSSPISSPSSPRLHSAVPFVRVPPVPPTGPSCVAGTLRKAESVRSEEVRHSPSQRFSTAPKRPSPLRNSFTAPLSAAGASKSADTGIETGPKPEGDQVAVIKKSHVMKAKLVSKGTILKSRRVSEPILRVIDTNVRHEVPPVPGLNKPATSILGRHNHAASADKEHRRTAVTHTCDPWSTMNEKDLGTGVDSGSSKRRLSTPLRNIFKFN